MEHLMTALLGAIQGATEFLPVSSSGHLALGQLLLPLQSLADQPMVMEVLLHLATLTAVIIYYRKEVQKLVVGAITVIAAPFRGHLTATLEDDRVRLLGYLVLGTIPTGIMGVAMEKSGVVATVNQTPMALGAAFLVCSLILLSTKWSRATGRTMNWKLALIIGVGQGLAVFPGISRSGTTIALALLLGMDRAEAAKFSFLLSIPAILGAAVLELQGANLETQAHLSPIVVGVVTAFGVGILSLALLVRLVRAGRLAAFAPYMALVGVACLFV